MAGGEMVDKLTARFNRKQGTMTPMQLKQHLETTQRVKDEFVEYDTDGSGKLDKEEMRIMFSLIDSAGNRSISRAASRPSRKASIGCSHRP